ncbi:MAG: 4-hydroxybenzoate octaprenyltransferase [Rickettsiales bacterium]|nr:4-hydroxybenzoate octaprenyltransferase [Rickettsiales bacterium]
MNQRFINYINLTRINRPIGIGLLFLPCLFAIFLIEKKIDLTLEKIFSLIIIFGLGSIIMRSSGCIINDIFDQKFDQNVARTKNRPLALGKVNRLEAFILLFFLLLIALVILLQFNSVTIISGFFILGLVIIYPLMKRITYYPQIFLGIVFNFGILMASLAITGKVSFDIIILYFSGIIWTLIYDTIYAYQDFEDDLKIGVKSTTIKFGKNPKKILLLLNLLMFSLLFYVGFLNNLNWHFFLINFAAFMILANKIKNCDFANGENCLKVFKNNFLIGSLILIAIFLG